MSDEDNNDSSVGLGRIQCNKFTKHTGQAFSNFRCLSPFPPDELWQIEYIYIVIPFPFKTYDFSHSTQEIFPKLLQ